MLFVPLRTACHATVSGVLAICCFVFSTASHEKIKAACAYPYLFCPSVSWLKMFSTQTSLCMTRDTESMMPEYYWKGKGGQLYKSLTSEIICNCIINGLRISHCSHIAIPLYPCNTLQLFYVGNFQLVWMGRQFLMLYKTQCVIDNLIQQLSSLMKRDAIAPEERYNSRDKHSCFGYVCWLQFYCKLFEI